MSYVPFLGLFFAGWKEDNEKIMKIIMKKIMKMIMLKSSSCLLGGKIRSPRLR